MNIDQVLAQAEYSSQHCDEEQIKFYKQVILLINELRDLRSKKDSSAE